MYVKDKQMKSQKVASWTPILTLLYGPPLAVAACMQPALPVINSTACL